MSTPYSVALLAGGGGGHPRKISTPQGSHNGGWWGGGEDINFMSTGQLSIYWVENMSHFL